MRARGRVVVADIVAGADPTVAARFNDLERARDPSHVRALTEAEILHAFEAAALRAHVAGSYRLAVELDSLLARSASPDPADVRSRFEHAIASGETIGVGERNEDDTIRFEFPIIVAVGESP